MKLSTAVKLGTRRVMNANPEIPAPLTPEMRIGNGPAKSLHNRGPGNLFLLSENRLQNLGELGIYRSNPAEYLTPTLFIHFRDRVKDGLATELLVDPQKFKPAVLKYLKKSFPQLEIQKVREGIYLNSKKLSSEENTDLHIDLQFFLQIPNIKPENVCSSLYNFEPKSLSQFKLYGLGGDLLRGKGAQALFIYGEPGGGKTHMAVAITKELLKKGGNVYLITGDINETLDPKKLALADYIIYDDFNSGFARGDTIRKIVEHADRSGARILITSNHPSFEELMFKESFAAYGKEKLPEFKALVERMFVQVRLDDIPNSYRQVVAWYTDPDLSKEFPEYLGPRPRNPGSITLPSYLLNDQACTTFVKAFPKLKVLQTPQATKMDTSGLNAEEYFNLHLDLILLTENPSIDRENLCCRVGNYKVSTDSEKALFEAAAQLINFDGVQASGLFMRGDTGIGKTHTSIALAKQFLMAGYNVYFHRAGTPLDAERLEASEVVIIDDLNDGYADQDSTMRIVEHIHTVCGKLFITSNNKWENIVNDIFSGNRSDQPKYNDRLKGMLKEIMVTGRSKRHDAAWYLDEQLDANCPKLQNEYSPTTAASSDLLLSIRRLLNYRGENSSGLFIHGDDLDMRRAAVDLLENSFKQQHLSVLRVNCSTDYLNKYDSQFADADVIILDDYDSGFRNMGKLGDIIQEVHQKGKVLIFSSAEPFEKVVLRESFVTSTQEIPRYKDRLLGMLMFHRLDQEDTNPRNII